MNNGFEPKVCVVGRKSTDPDDESMNCNAFARKYKISKSAVWKHRREQCGCFTRPRPKITTKMVDGRRVSTIEHEDGRVTVVEVPVGGMMDGRPSGTPESLWVTRI